MKNYGYDRRGERRRGPDVWFKMISWLSFIGWLLMLIALVLFDLAKPQMMTFFDRFFHVSFASVWNYQLTLYIFFVMIAGFFLSLIGLTINAKRHRRKKDKYSLSLILLGIVSFMGAAFYLIRFWRQY